MIEEFEYKGTWWLPEKPKKQVFGTLKFVPGEGATLDLVGSLKSTRDVTALFAPDVILGVSWDDAAITLQNCHEMGATRRLAVALGR